jgi:hypothetical protein
MAMFSAVGEFFQIQPTHQLLKKSPRLRAGLELNGEPSRQARELCFFIVGRSQYRNAVAS